MQTKVSVFKLVYICPDTRKESCNDADEHLDKSHHDDILIGLLFKFAQLSFGLHRVLHDLRFVTIKHHNSYDIFSVLQRRTSQKHLINRQGIDLLTYRQGALIVVKDFIWCFTIYPCSSECFNKIAFSFTRRVCFFQSLFVLHVSFSIKILRLYVTNTLSCWRIEQDNVSREEFIFLFFYESSNLYLAPLYLLVFAGIGVEDMSHKTVIQVVRFMPLFVLQNVLYHRYYTIIGQVSVGQQRIILIIGKGIHIFDD